MTIKLRVIVNDFFASDSNAHDVFEREISAQTMPHVGDPILISEMAAVVTEVWHPLRKGVLSHNMLAVISVKKTRGVHFDVWQEMNDWTENVLHPLMDKERFNYVSTSGLDGE